jgi:hypothetical protein
VSEKEENKYLYDRLTNAYATQAKARFRRRNIGGSDPIEKPRGPSATSDHPSKKYGLLAIAITVALIIGLAILFLHF